MIVFFSIPMWLILFLLIGAIAIVSELMSFIIFFIYMIMGTISWFFYYGFLREKQSDADYKSKIGLFFTFMFGSLCTVLCAYIFSRKGARLSGFMVIMLFNAIMCVVSYFLASAISSRLRLLSSFILILGAILTAIWSIGYDISYTLKSDYRNIAYFECTTIKKSGWGSTGKIYNSLESSRKPVGSFKTGDIFYPYFGDHPKNLTQGLKYQNEDLWPIDYNGKIAYIPSVNFEPRYWQESNFIDEQRSSVIGRKRYSFLPEQFLHACELLFDCIPLGVPFKLVSS